MAAVIGDYVSDLSRFHTMINSPSALQQQHQSPAQHSPRSRSSPDRPRPVPTSSSTSATAPQTSRQHNLARQQQQSPLVDGKTSSPASSTATTQFHFSPNSDAAYTAARFPSPPPSSSPSAVAPPADDANGASMATQTRDFVSPTHNAASSHNVNPTQAATATPTAGQQQPSPPSDDLARSSNPSQTGRRGWRNPAGHTTPQNVVHVRDLAHVQSLVQERVLGGAAAGAAGQTQYEISAMPIGDVIEMVAALLTKITGTNDLQHDAMQRNATHQQQANQTHESSSQMSPLSHSVLAFHGKNVPAITILSYLARIHKYCPTTYEVFLSLLVYFDRMTERVNDLVVKSEHARRRDASLTTQQPPSQSRPQSQSHSRSGSRQQDMNMQDSAPAADNSDESDSDLADDDDDDEDDAMVDSPTVAARNDSSDGRIITVPDERPSVHGPATYFVVDSFNIHRLIIAGVTCASKFFSDVFYTNSRYAKVRNV